VPNFYGDFYPLTPHSLANDVWIAWQFNRPERGRGMVQAFRRPGSPFEVARWPLKGLDVKARYRLHVLGTDQTWQMTGDDMMQDGVRTPIEERPGAAVILYERITDG
jgi:alpha-galactosidase